MKKTKMFGWALIALASITSCTNDAEEIFSLESEIKLTSEITPSRVTSLDYQSTQIVEGQQVGVTITGAKSEHKNVPWAVGADGALTNGGDAIYYSGNNEATITAYHPFNDDWDKSTNYAFSVNTDQSNEANYRNSDLLWATASSSKTDKAVGLIFAHKLAKVNVTLTSTDIADLSGATISICGTNIVTNFNPSTGELSATTADVQEIKAGVTTEEAYTASAIVVPQTVANGTKFIKVVLGNQTFYYTLPSPKELKSGYSHNYTLTVKEKELEIETESDKITDWTDENGNIGDAEEEVVIAKTITVETAGTLSTLITEEEKYKITSLTISGPLNGNDIQFIRNLTSYTTSEEERIDAIVKLDLSNARFIGEGSYKYINPIGNTTTITMMDNAIGEGMFRNCRYIQTIILPNDIIIINDYAFEYCTSLKSITLPNTVTSFGFCAFGDCSSLTSINIPTGMTEIGASSLSGCTSLKSISIPNNITSISTYAFSYSALTSITIPTNVKEIGEGAFTICN